MLQYEHILGKQGSPPTSNCFLEASLTLPDGQLQSLSWCGVTWKKVHKYCCSHLPRPHIPVFDVTGGPLLSTPMTLSWPFAKSQQHFCICWTDITFALCAPTLSVDVMGSMFLWPHEQDNSVHSFSCRHLQLVTLLYLWRSWSPSGGSSCKQTSSLLRSFIF